jgi:hypothetical protein
MFGVGVVLLLALGTMSSPASAQGDPGRQDRPRGLRQNFPNPFNPETTIPFELDSGLFESGNPVYVTIRIFDIFRRPVAIPTALNHPAGDRSPVSKLLYTTPGLHEAYWDGHNKDGDKVASGVYIVLLEVNGRPYGEPKKMTVAK